jgi:hypothetical protein
VTQQADKNEQTRIPQDHGWPGEYEGVRDGAADKWKYRVHIPEEVERKNSTINVIRRGQMNGRAGAMTTAVIAVHDICRPTIATI